MALFPRKQVEPHSIKIELDGILASSVRASIVAAFIKDILYQRQQVPMTYDQIVKDLGQQKNDLTSDKTSRSRWTNLEIRRKKSFIEGLTDLFKKLDGIFSTVSSVRSVLVLLGATIISPKESYLIQFPTAVQEGKILSLRLCKTALFRNLVSSSFFLDVPHPNSCNKMFVLLEIDNSSCHDLALLPKPAFKCPTRGHRLHIKFICNTPVTSAELSRMNDSDLEISGIEPLHHSVMDDQEHDLETLLNRSLNLSASSNTIEPSSSSCSIDSSLDDTSLISGSSDFVMDTDSSNIAGLMESPMMTCDAVDDLNLSCCDKDYSWYQMPGFIQGFKDKTTRAASDDFLDTIH